MIDSDLYEDIEATLRENISKDTKQAVRQGLYKLGEVVGPHNVKYWGQLKAKDGSMTAMFICPFCDSTFRQYVTQIKAGKCKSCGCLLNKEKKNAK